MTKSLTCVEVEPGRVKLRPAEHRRAWMDATPESFAYHCTPLVMANSHGWEMLCPVGFEAVWNGKASLDAVQVKLAGPGPQHLVESHFGSGILTFNPLVIVRTPPGHNLWVSGPPNSFKDGIQALSAVIEADWMPFTFSMSWKMTRPGLTVKFEKGEPFCFFFPVVRRLVDEIDPVVSSLSREPEIAKTYWSTRFQRNLAGMRKVKEDQRGWYTRGTKPDGSPGVEGHQTRVAAKPFRRP